MNNKSLDPTHVWIIGTDPQCDVVVNERDVAPRHCLLAQYPTGYALEDLGTPTGTWLNGQRMQPRKPEWVHAADAITLGSSARFPWPNQEADSKRNSSAGGIKRVVTIGRAPENDVVLDYSMISWNHARLTEQAGGRLSLEDLGSTNGTAVGQATNRIQSAEVTRDDSVFFGSFKIRVEKLLEPEKIALGKAIEETVHFSGTQMVIGRDPECDYPLSYPMVSWHHAKLQKTAQGIEIEDLGSRNGTFVDGKRINGRVRLKTGSEIGLGSLRFRLLDEAGNLGKRDYTGNVTVEATNVVVVIQAGGVPRRLLDPISLTIFPSELVALMGPAGAGKTTFLKVLNGYTPPTEGHVRFNGDDLYTNQEQFRLQIGYVPQDDILHPQLTVKEALSYTAKLRTDLREHEIEARVMQVLKDLNIDDIGNRLIGSPERKVISGGQRKRVNIAMELLSDPSVLFLDEPTSGLSSHDAFHVMQLLRKLADNGKTIITTIHQPSIDIFKEFDSLIMVARDKGDNAGMLVYFGPAYPDSIAFFNPELKKSGASSGGSPEMLMSGVAARTAADWANNYSRSQFKKGFVEARAGQVIPSSSAQAQVKPKRDFGVGQWLTLSKRNVRLKLRDRMQTLILLGQAPLFAILVSIVFNGLSDRQFHDMTAWVEFSAKIASVHFLVVVAAVWFGCNNAARDIVGETAIFLRERMVNLKLPSYVFSKISVLLLICIFQCITLLSIVYFLCNLSGSFLLMLCVLIVASLVGTTLGLLISALSPTTESAIAFLPVVLLPFILLGGGIKPVHEMPKAAQLIAAICPTRWAYEANLLDEAKHRKSSFTNDAQKQCEACRTELARYQARAPVRNAGMRPATPPSSTSAEVQSDVAASAFPVKDGRSSAARSFQVLGIFFGSLLILILTTLSLKPQH